MPSTPPDFSADRVSNATKPSAEPFSPPATTDSIFAYMPLVLVFAFLALGATLDFAAAKLSWRFWFNVGAIGCLFWLLSFVKLFGNARLVAGSILLSLILTACGGLWRNCYWNVYSRTDLASRCTEKAMPCIVRGEIIDAPRRMRPKQGLTPIPDSERIVFTLKAKAIRDGLNWVPADGLVRVTSYSSYWQSTAGDVIELAGQLSRPADTEQSQFNYRDFLRTRRTLTVMTARNADAGRTISQRNWRRSLSSWIALISQEAQAGLENRFSDDRQANLAAAFLLGNRTQLPESVIESYQETGVMHILVVSGLHVGILAWLLQSVVRFFPVNRKMRYIIVSVMIVLYIALTGMQPPAVRAGIVCLFVMAAIVLNRQALSLNILALAGIVVWAINPMAFFQPGTQLSFLIVGSVLVLTKPIETLIDRILHTDKSKSDEFTLQRPSLFSKIIRQVAFLLISSVLILGIIAPLLATNFHVLSPFSILLNLLLSVPIFVALTSGIITMLFGMADSFFLFDWIANGSAVVCQFSLWIMDIVVQMAHSQRWTRFWVSGLSEWSLAAFYFLLGLWAFSRWGRNNSLKMASLLACWLAMIALIPVCKSFLRPEQMNVEFINVEHGLCTLIRLPDGINLLYDAGKMTNPQQGAQSVCEFLWRQNVTKIHGVILSHADADHYNMFPALADRFAVDTVYISPHMFVESDNDTLDRFKSFLDNSNIQTITVTRGDRLGNSKQYSIEFLHPGFRSVLDLISPENANSLVVALKYANRSVLLTGDLVGQGIADIMMEDSPGYDVLQAPHHGSYLSLTPEFIRWTGSKCAVFSESRAFPQKRGRLMFEHEGVPVIHTGLDGSARFAIFPSGKMTCKTGNQQRAIAL